MAMESKIFGGSYIIDRELARGGMGIVYHAVHLNLGTEVALKVVQGAIDDEMLERFEREAKLTATLDHPNIVRVTDYGREKNSPFLVMEFVRGRSLYDIIRDEGFIEPYQAAEWLEKI